MKTTLPPRQQGFSLVEVLVSTVVALFATLVIVQTFAVAEGYRRTGTSGGDAAFSGALGAYLMERDLGIAGYGVNTAAYLGCATSGSDSIAGTARAINFTLAPVQITPGAAITNPDSITVVASGTDMMPGPINFTTALASPASDYTVTSGYGVQAGDVVLVAQPGQNCTIVQATNTPAAGTATQNTIQHATGTYTSALGTFPARYNPGGGIGPTYGANAVAMDMGATPVVSTYYVQNNTLMVDQLISGQLQQPVAANVVQMKALYGKDTNNDGIVDTWDNVAPTTAAGWAAVLAVRLAVVARSANPEKPSNPLNNTCSTTTVAPSVTWDDGSTTTLDVSASADWMCYRYKAFHFTAGLRNLIWTPS